MDVEPKQGEKYKVLCAMYLAQKYYAQSTGAAPRGVGGLQEDGAVALIYGALMGHATSRRYWGVTGGRGRVPTRACK